MATAAPTARLGSGRVVCPARRLQVVLLLLAMLAARDHACMRARVCARTDGSHGARGAASVCSALRPAFAYNLATRALLYNGLAHSLRSLALPPTSDPAAGLPADARAVLLTQLRARVARGWVEPHLGGLRRLFLTQHSALPLGESHSAQPLPGDTSGAGARAEHSGERGQPPPQPHQPSAGPWPWLREHMGLLAKVCLAALELPRELEATPDPLEAKAVRLGGWDRPDVAAQERLTAGNRVSARRLFAT
jgi:hypothetical protein